MRMKTFIFLVMMICFAGTSVYAQNDFTEGNLVLLRIPLDGTTSDGTATSNGDGALPMFLEEWDPKNISAGVKKTVALPTTVDGNNYRVLGNGSNAYYHWLSRSIDGRYLVVQGYDVTEGTSVAKTVPYSITKPTFALINYTGTVDSRTRINADITGQDAMRNALSYDGTGIWFANAGTQSMHYMPVGNSAASTYLGGSSARAARFDGKQLLMSRSGSIQKIGTTESFPIASSTLLTGIAVSNLNPLDFVVLNGANCANKVLYIVDITSGSVGIKKFFYEESENKLTYKGAIALPGASTLTGKIKYDSNNEFEQVELYVVVSTGSTSKGLLYKVVDDACFNEDVSASSPTLLKDFTGGNSFVRGVAWAPLEHSILPVKLESFKAIQTTEGIRLNWATASEQSNAYFEVLRSVDGENFEKVGTVKGSGTTSTTRIYSFTDVNVSNGLYYYQLRQVDINGKSETNSPIPVKFTMEKESFKVWITTDAINVKLKANKAQKVEVLVSDVLGRTLIKKDVYVTEGENQFNLGQIRSKSPYIIKFLLGDKVYTEKLVY